MQSLWTPDLQDDAEAIESMIDAYHEGVEILYMVFVIIVTLIRHFKRGTAHMFYRMMSWLGTQTIPDHADFRLMSAPVPLVHYPSIRNLICSCAV